MIKLLKHFRWYYWLLIVLILALTILGVCADLRMPDLLSNILNNAHQIEDLREKGELINDSLIQSMKADIWSDGLLMLANAAISFSCVAIVAFIAAKISAGFAHDLRDEVYKKVQNLSLTEIDKFSTSSLMTRTTNDINQVQMVLVMVLRMALAAPFMAILGIINATAHAEKSNLNVLVILAVISLTVLVITLFSIVYPKFKEIQKNTDDLNLVTRENLTGIRVVRANNAQDYEENKFEGVNNRLTRTNIFVNRVVSILNPGINIIMNMTSLLILWVGAYAIAGGMPIGNVFGFQQYTMMICMAFMVLIMIFVSVPRGQVSANRINEVLRIHNLIEDPDCSKSDLSEGAGSIEFKNVVFKYPGSEEAVLENISFKVNPGETLAIIGSTGSGKTTILNLMNRFYDVTEGEILIDNVNVKDYKQSELHDKIGLVPQKSNLFMGTIKSNLEFGYKNPTDEDINRALEVSQSAEFVRGLKDGINSWVSQGGQNYSGGQRQRLCIARAIIKKSEIYAFDDSFSALDLKTDKALRDALAKDSHKATNIIVAQRIGTIINADKIIVLEEGKIVGFGNHKELMASCPVYQEIALSQLSKEEL